MPDVCGRGQQLGLLLLLLRLLRLLLEEDVLPHLSQAHPQRLHLTLQVGTPPTQSLALRLKALQARDSRWPLGTGRLGTIAAHILMPF